VVADQFGTPTPAALIAEVSAQVLQYPSAVSGLWHLTAQGQASWHGFAEAIFQQASRAGALEREPRVLPIGTAQYLTRAQRPSYSCLDTSSIKTTFGIDLPDWRTALEQLLPVLPR
jgi:dTDP-4-dehydrorhamnose reductase